VSTGETFPAAPLPAADVLHRNALRVAIHEARQGEAAANLSAVRAIAEPGFAAVRNHGTTQQEVTLADGAKVGLISIYKGGTSTGTDEDLLFMIAAGNEPADLEDFVQPAALSDPRVLALLSAHLPALVSRRIKREAAALYAREIEDNGGKVLDRSGVLGPAGERVKVATITHHDATGKFSYRSTAKGAQLIREALDAGLLTEDGEFTVPAVEVPPEPESVTVADPSEDSEAIPPPGDEDSPDARISRALSHTRARRPAKSEHPPTGEQQAILDAVKTGDGVVISAGAGAGKTSSLVMIGEQERDRQGLYVAFNAAIVADAKPRFGPDVRVSTAHALAMAAVGRSYRHRLNAARVPVTQVAKILGINEPLRVAGDRVLAPAQLARLVMETVDKFCRSADPELTSVHVPRKPGLDTPDALAVLRTALTPWARKAWTDLTATHGQLRFSHDVYLKMWGLSRPQLGTDYILYDECQDADAVVADIVLNQKDAQLIAVGDKAQAIYCQPAGTMVEVPTLRDAAPEESRCSEDDCPRRRNHVISGRCDQHERQARSGAEISPIRRTPKTVTTARVPIESLSAGDTVVTYDNSHVFTRGRPVTSTTRFPYSGPLVEVTTGSGVISSYTPQHHCVVRVGRDLDGTHVVYMMRRGDRFRIGRVPFSYGSQGKMFGLGLRAKAEKADAAWILSIHDSVKDAVLAEYLTQHQFNIPGVRFEPSGNQDVLDVNLFWEKHGPNQQRAGECLAHFGRLADFPLWVSGRQMLVGVRRPFVTAAANLVDGFRVLPISNLIRYHGKRDYSAPAQQWETIRTRRTWYEGDIISLEVADHHTYFADGILTHNSWRGAIDAMDGFPAKHRLPLSKSFRFGPAIADEANKWLEILDADLRLTGFDQVPSVLRPLDAADAVLCRTNAEVIAQAMRSIKAGRPTAIVGGGKDIRALAEAAAQLKQGRGTSHPELYAFKTWGEVQDHAENDPSGSDLRVLVNLIDANGPEKIIEVVDSLTDEKHAQVAISTTHKCKGREWDSVRIANDFHPPKGSEDDPDGGRISPPDARLAYVAVTRAKLTMDRSGLAWVDEHVPERATAGAA
jgi:AAA domain/UvrD-like helicase C-terminal domain